jgi:hypothetical protein
MTLGQFGYFLPVMLVRFYHGHRLLHHRLLYKHAHKVVIIF